MQHTQEGVFASCIARPWLVRAKRAIANVRYDGMWRLAGPCVPAVNSSLLPRSAASSSGQLVAAWTVPIGHGRRVSHLHNDQRWVGDVGVGLITTDAHAGLPSTVGRVTMNVVFPGALCTVTVPLWA